MISPNLLRQMPQGQAFVSVGMPAEYTMADLIQLDHIPPVQGRYTPPESDSREYSFLRKYERRHRGKPDREPAGGPVVASEGLGDDLTRVEGPEPAKKPKKSAKAKKKSSEDGQGRAETPKRDNPMATENVERTEIAPEEAQQPKPKAKKAGRGIPEDF